MSLFSRNTQGFTLIELLITMSIAMVILTVVVLNQSKYTNENALSNLADQIGLTISQAQAYGVGVKEVSAGSSEFSASYGLSLSLLGSGSNTAYLFFADRNGDNIYGGDWTCPVGGVSECLEKFNISRGNYIQSLCVVYVSGADLCTVGRLDISFVRPSTEAQLRFFDVGGNAFAPANLKGARVVVQSPAGSTRSVVIYGTGQVSIQ